jgi:hypothetical protein
MLKDWAGSSTTGTSDAMVSASTISQKAGLMIDMKAGL